MTKKESTSIAHIVFGFYSWRGKRVKNLIIGSFRPHESVQEIDVGREFCVLPINPLMITNWRKVGLLRVWVKIVDSHAAPVLGAC